MTTSVRAGLSAAVLALGLAAATPAHAAPTVTTRVAGYTVTPTTVAKGNSITVKGSAQKLTGKTWVATANTAAQVYFDADGAAKNTLQRSLKAASNGSFSTTFKPTVSGYWTVILPATTTNKAATTSRVYVRVTTPAPTKPAPSKTSVVMPKGSASCPSWAPLKGNAQSRIFHAPGQRFYAKTHPEICFATPAAAIKAGYRAAKI